MQGRSEGDAWGSAWGTGLDSCRPRLHRLMGRKWRNRLHPRHRMTSSPRLYMETKTGCFVISVDRLSLMVKIGARITDPETQRVKERDAVRRV